MRFKEFWPLYIHAHRLPGTRALHYFATIVGILCAIEAVAARQPWIFVAGIAASYAIAVSSHWLVERNQPLIRVNAVLGAVADLRMCWLALSGRMEDELARHGVLQTASADADGPDGAALDLASRGSGRSPRPPSADRFRFQYGRYALLIASTAGLTAGLADLSDLAEPMAGFAHPFIQLGAPILAFAGALAAAFAAIVAAQRCPGALVDATIRRPLMRADAAPSRGAHDDMRISRACETSLRRACLTLLALGTLAFGLAELAEHGLPDPTQLSATIAGLATLLCIGGALVWHVSAAGRAHPPSIADAAGPDTRGLRVDGRVQLVDMLENLLSLGRRRAILAATLDAACLRRGDRMIDIGCGTGELVLMAERLARGRGGESVVMGIDATPGMIAIARDRAREAGSAARFEVAVAESLPVPDESVDAVTSTFFFHHLPTEVKREAMREMWRVLAPGGRLIITDYGWARGIVGLIASFPMRFNFHEYVRPQLNGEIERLIAEEGLPIPQTARVFLGYIRVLRVVKSGGAP